MDYNLFREIDCGDFDVLMFYDYSSLDIDGATLEQINGYGQKFLITWSMGTWMGAKVFQNFTFNFSLAIAGTLKPVDDNFGIIEKDYQNTIDYFGNIAKVKFFKRMWNNYPIPEKFRLHKTTRNNQGQLDELLFLRSVSQANSMPEFKFDRVVLMMNDIITPTSNQINFWKTQDSKTIELEGPHFPFYKWESWLELLSFARGN